MSVFEQLADNKGTISNALGKSLAKKVLEESRFGILHECIDLTVYRLPDPSFKNIRAGAAKVVEIVAEEQPALVAAHLEQLLPALKAPEPQTRWMVIRTMGFCAHLNKYAAEKAIAYAERYIREKEGLIVASSADLFLGDFGAISQEDARVVFPILERSMSTVITNEQDWILEALMKIFPNLGDDEQEKALKFAGQWQDFERKSTRLRAQKVMKLKR